MRRLFFAVCGPMFTKLSRHCMGVSVDYNAVFWLMIILFRSGDNSPSSCDDVRNRAKIVIFLGRQFFGGGGPKFLTQFYKRQSPPNTWQSLVTIGPETSKIRRRKKIWVNTSSILQWPSVSQLTGGHNKAGNAYHIRKKFAANIPYIIGIYVQNLVIIGSCSISKKLYNKKSDGHIREPEHSRRQSLI